MALIYDAILMNQHSTDSFMLLGEYGYEFNMRILQNLLTSYLHYFTTYISYAFFKL